MKHRFKEEEMMMTKKEKKRVPELRFVGFEEEWERKVLGKRCLKIGDGLHGTPKYVDDSGIYFINGNNIVSGKIEIYENTKQVSEKVYKKNEKEINENTLLISINGTIGNIGWYNNEPVMLGKSVGYLTFPEKPSFEFHYLNTSKAQRFFVSQLTGTTIKNLSLKTLRETSIYIPQLEEQQKIASFLTSIDTRIQQLEKKKTLLEQYKKGVMQKIFSQEIRFKDDDGEEFGEWEEKRLGDISKITTGSSNRQDSTLTGEYTFFDRSMDIRTSSIYLFDGEAVIVAGEGSDFIPKYFAGKFDLHQRTYAIMDYIGAKGLFLFYHIYYYKNYFLQQAVGSTVKSLRLPMFQKMPLLLPCLKEQTKIADFLSALDRKIAVVDEQIEGTKGWKKGLLQKMFV